MGVVHMKSTRLSTRRWEFAKALFRRSIAAYVDETGVYPTRRTRKDLWRLAYGAASAYIEMIRVRPREAPAPAPAQRLPDLTNL